MADFDPTNPAEVCPMTNLVRQQIEAILKRWEEADRRFLKARFNDDGTSNTLAKYLAEQDFLEASGELADLTLYLLRHTIRRRPEKLRGLLLEALKPELDSMAGMILKLLDGSRQHARR